MTDRINPLLKPLKIVIGGLLLVLCVFASPLRAEPPVTRIEAWSPRGVQGVLEFEAAPLTTMQEISFRLSLKDADGKVLTPSQVICDLVMPAMPMPENRPRLSLAGQSYSGKAIFTMAGEWQARISIQSASGTAETLVFPIDRVLLK